MATKTAEVIALHETINSLRRVCGRAARSSRAEVAHLLDEIGAAVNTNTNRG